MKALDKIEKLEPPKKRRSMKFDFRRPPRSGDDVAMLQGISKTYGKRTVYDGFNFMVRRGERWCVMGKNGAGKSTLLKMVSGSLEPDAGNVRLGASLKMGYFSQQAFDVLDPNLTVWEQIQKDFPLESIGTLRSLLGAFQFSGDEVEKKIRSLSGGERSRLVLARMLLDPPNFLVLDEPTNHLDLAHVPARPLQSRSRIAGGAGSGAAGVRRLVRGVRQRQRPRSARRARVTT